MLRNVYGLDLGTYEIKIYDKKQDRIWKEKNVVAIENGDKIYAYGDQAYEMYEKSPENIEVLFPMQNGEISNFQNMQYLLTGLLKNGKRKMFGAKYVLAVPADVTEVQKRAFFDLVIHSSAKAKEVAVVRRGVADAVGFGLQPEKEKGLFVINLGAETTELSVLSYGGLVLNKLIKTGGSTLDELIVTRIRHTYNFLIGKLTAESLRNQFGLFDDAIKETLNEVAISARTMLERTPPDILPEIQKKGLYITGGLARLSGISTYIEGVTNLKVTVSKNPELAAVKGLRQIISSKELQKLTCDMSDDDFRWMR